MKKMELCLLVCLTFSCIAPSALLAQSDIPLCCPRSPGILPGETPAAPQSPALGARFIVFKGLPESQGLTRRQFVDRLLQGLFADTRVDVVVYDKMTFAGPIPDAGSPSFTRGRQAFLVEATRVFRIPLFELTVEEFERLDRFALTDGRVSIEVRFVEAGTAAENPDGQ